MFNQAGVLTAHRSEFLPNGRHPSVSPADSFMPALPSADALGQRVETNVGGTKTEYIYGIDGHVVAETDGSGNWQTGYVYMGNQLLAEYSNGTTYFIHADHLGSTRLRTTVSGTVYDSFDYLPFGEVLSGINDYVPKFTGDALDNETAWTRLLRPDAFDRDHTLFRQYAGSLGRWMSPDPLAVDIADPQSLNRYAYVENNPLGYIDPLGADIEEIPSRCFDPFGGLVDYCPVFGGDECASGSSCDGGGGGVVFGGGGGSSSSSSGNHNHPVLNESNGVPPGIRIPGGPNIFLPIDPGCDFGVCNSSAATIAVSLGPSGKLLCDGGACSQIVPIIRVYVWAKAPDSEVPANVNDVIQSCFDATHDSGMGKYAEPFSILSHTPANSNWKRNIAETATFSTAKLAFVDGLGPSAAAGTAAGTIIHTSAEYLAPLGLLAGTGADLGNYLTCAAGGYRQAVNPFNAFGAMWHP